MRTTTTRWLALTVAIAAIQDVHAQCSFTPNVINDPSPVTGPGPVGDGTLDPSGRYAAFRAGFVVPPNPHAIHVRDLTGGGPASLAYDLTNTTVPQLTTMTWSRAAPSWRSYLVIGAPGPFGATLRLHDAATNSGINWFSLGGTSSIAVQQSPCQDIVSFVGRSGSQRTLYTADISGPNAPVTILSTSDELIAFDVDPSESYVLYGRRVSVSGGGQGWDIIRYDRATQAHLTLIASTNLFTVADFPRAAFGATGDDVFLSFRITQGVPPSNTYNYLSRLDVVSGALTQLGNSLFEEFDELYVQPGHLQPSPVTRDVLTYSGDDAVGPFANLERVAVMPVIGGGEELFFRSALVAGSALRPTMDAAASRIAFLDGSNFYYLDACEEVRVAPVATPGASLTINTPVVMNQSATLFVSAGLAPPFSLPWILGQVWLDAATTEEIYGGVTSGTGAIVTPLPIPATTPPGAEIGVQVLRVLGDVVELSRPTRVRVQ